MRMRGLPIYLNEALLHTKISDAFKWGLFLDRGSYMSAHVLLNLSNELGKRDKRRGLPRILSVFATSLIKSIIQEREC